MNFLSRLVGHPVFREGRVDTGLIERERATLIPTATELPKEIFEVAALAQLAAEREQGAQSISPWSVTDGWRINGTQNRTLQFSAGEQTATVALHMQSSGYVIGDEPARVQHTSDSDLRITIGQRHINTAVVKAGEQLHVFLRGQQYVLTYVDPLVHAGEAEETQGGLTAPMPGKIIALLSEPGAEVAKVRRCS